MTCTACNLSRGTEAERRERLRMLPMIVGGFMLAGGAVDLRPLARCWAPSDEVCAWEKARGEELS